MKANELYNIRRLNQWQYRIVKFDDDFNVIEQYVMTERSAGGFVDCPCKEGLRHNTCRHRTMLDFFRQVKKVDTGWFYDYGRNKWVPPIRFFPRLPVKKGQSNG